MSHADTGSVLQNDTAALMVGPSGRIELLLPAYDDDTIVPDNVLFLIAVMMRADGDPDFMRDQTEWLKAQSSS